jgi:putative ABC transport system permease protein
MTGFTLAVRTAGRYKARTILAVAGVAIIGALNFDMLLLSRGLVLSFAEMLRSAGFDVRVSGGGGAPALRLPIKGAAELAEEIRRLPQIEDVMRLSSDQASASVAGRPEVWAVIVATSEPAGHGGWTLIEGDDLTAEESPGVPTVVLTKQLAATLGVRPGSAIRLRVEPFGERAMRPAFECRIVGLADFTFEAAGTSAVLMTMDGFRFVHGGAANDEADLLLVASRSGSGPDAAIAAIRKLRSGLQVFSTDQLIQQFNRNSFAYFRQISLVLSSTTAGFTVLLVATLLTISVNQRLGEIAAFRAIGISRRRVAAMLLWESALLAGIGGILALPLGGVLAVRLDRILHGIPGLPERLHFFVFETRALFLHVLLLAATTMVAALYPVWLAVTLPIASTLRREIVS